MSTNTEILDWYQSQPFTEKEAAARLFGLVSVSPIKPVDAGELANVITVGESYWDAANGPMVAAEVMLNDEGSALGVMSVYIYGGDRSIAFTEASRFFPNPEIDGVVECTRGGDPTE